ncbi:MAG: AhpC/TSA family protein [Cyclobacteriaceae bacterium]|nr:AhpC/TSA family protein [Cyclobacteriaceae bacterium]
MKNKLTILLLLISMTTFSQSPSQWGVNENKHVPVGLNIGTKAPEFIADDHNGERVNLKELLTKGKVVLLFYRGQWCPVCNRYLSNFQDSVQYILDRGISVIAITPETTENAIVTIKNTGLTFSVVSDIQGEIMKKYDVLFYVTEKYQNIIKNHLETDIAENNGNKNEAALLPVPATYIINQNGNIEKVFFDYNYKKRATVSDILNQL